MLEIISDLNSFIWGPPLLIFLLTGNIFLLLVSRFAPLKYFRYSLSLLKTKNTNGISQYQALTNALAATIGLGNIAGVAVALSQGGAGAIFWMWVTAIIGMNAKFFECSLALVDKRVNYKGQMTGGPMYVMEKNLPKGKIFSYFFSICGLVGTLSLFQVNQLSQYVSNNFAINQTIFGFVIAALILIIIVGGIDRISRVTSKLVPAMSIFYIMTCLCIILINITNLPDVFISIFKGAFNMKSAASGVAGYGLIQVITAGVKRATFSNEAGLGTAPLAHADTDVDNPAKEGLTAMLGPFWDTIIICSLTAISILISVDIDIVSQTGIVLVQTVYEKNFGIYGNYLLGVSVGLFSLSTMVGMANYNIKCWDYIFKGRFFFKNTLYYTLYAITLIIGAVISTSSVVDLIDLAYALMAIPNMIITIKMSGYVMKKMRELKNERSNSKVND